ncbi:SARM1 protein, partial [Polypterus senegalus]
MTKESKGYYLKFISNICRELKAQPSSAVTITMAGSTKGELDIRLSSTSLTVPDCRSQQESLAASPGLSADVVDAMDAALPPLREALRKLKAATCVSETKWAIADIFHQVEAAWVLPAVGRKVAEEICHTIRLEGGLDLLLQLLQSAETDVKRESAKLLEQVLVAENRDRIARMGLGVILNLSRERDDAQLIVSTSGILEHMFKHTEETCFQLITNGALDAVLYWCRSTDPAVQQHCAVALANCAMHGGHTCQRLMISKQAAEWLFPLAFSKEDELIRFHACLAITVLAANKEIEKEVVRSGTLELVEPFIASLDPDEFACNLLQNEIGAVQSLKRLVSYSRDGITSGLAKRTLRMMGEDIPRRISPTVPNWKPSEVQTWLQQIGFMSYIERFQGLQVDGDLLLHLTEQDLSTDLGMTTGLTRKRFLRELRELKTYANYSTCDPSNLADWLGGVDPRFRQYAYNMLQCGLERSSLPSVTEQQLQTDCGIENGVHRYKILEAAKGLSPVGTPSRTEESQAEGPDVFISYRRTTGSQLASLLKVHLQVRGFSVFIDVEKLEAGKFEDKLLQSVKRARNFILVLSANALDKCMGDQDMKDWVHKEIVTALNDKKNIVPVIDQFQWPDPESLPEDMRAVIKFNGVMWSHEYQEATIDKILRFLQGRPSQDLGTFPNGFQGPVVLPHGQM